MKLASIDNSSRDGCLAVVSQDGARYLPAGEIVPCLQEMLENWTELAPILASLSEQLDQGGGKSLQDVNILSPLPRAWQWLDGSAFKSHGDLMEKVFGIDPVPQDNPLMYQGMSHRFISATDDVEFLREEDDIDFEGELGIITDDVPMGISAEAAMDHIKLIVQINDWSLRRLAPAEMKTGFGWIRAKPACSMAPFAVTPDELGDAWQDGRVHLPLTVDWNGERFGNAQAGVMDIGFHELIAHAAATRDLCAGTVIGSGTVSNENFREIGSSCIAERRGIEIVDEGKPRTNFMQFGDRVRMEVCGPDGSSVFGAIEQSVTRRSL
ncbi:MAG: fumarylacetoacetate hydrolase family protein [Halioglobus sp.]